MAGPSQTCGLQGQLRGSRVALAIKDAGTSTGLATEHAYPTTTRNGRSTGHTAWGSSAQWKLQSNTIPPAMSPLQQLNTNNLSPPNKDTCEKGAGGGDEGEERCKWSRTRTSSEGGSGWRGRRECGLGVLGEVVGWRDKRERRKRVVGCGGWRAVSEVAGTRTHRISG
jgi:hypothetical protein